MSEKFSWCIFVVYCTFSPGVDHQLYCRRGDKTKTLLWNKWKTCAGVVLQSLSVKVFDLRQSQRIPSCGLFKLPLSRYSNFSVTWQASLVQQMYISLLSLQTITAEPLATYFSNIISSNYKDYGQQHMEACFGGRSVCDPADGRWPCLGDRRGLNQLRISYCSAI